MTMNTKAHSRVSAEDPKTNSKEGAEPSRWFDLPSGGVLEMDRKITPPGCALELEVIVVDGKPKWLWVLENGQALGFVRPGVA